MSIFSEPITFVDIETTGMSSGNSKIIEVAAFRVEDDVIVDEFHSLVNPGTAVPYYITNITGITSADVAEQPTFEAIAQRLEAILDGAIFAAHNVRFDLSFVKRQLEAASARSFNPKLFCTVRLSRALYAQARGHSLAKIIERHQLPVSARHRAREDARVLWEFCKLAHREHGEATFAEAVRRQLKSKTLPPNLDSKAVETLTDEPGVYIFEDEAGRPLYVGKSIKLKSRVKSHFGSSSKIKKELKMSQATHGLRVIKTAGEMEALLLESRLVKEMLPLYNQQLRRAREYAVLYRNSTPEGYFSVSLSSARLAETDDLSGIYGVYLNRSKAKAALLQHRETFGLCSKLLGIEKGSGACFRYHLGRCQGACIGREDAENYNQRVELALARSKLESWPFETAVVVKEIPPSGNPSSGFIIDKWCVVGRVYYDTTGRQQVEHMKKIFDIDTYKILRSYILKRPEKISIEPIAHLLQ